MPDRMRLPYTPGDLIRVIFFTDPCIVVEVINDDKVRQMPGSHVLYKVISPQGVGFAFEHEILGRVCANSEI